MAQVKKAKLIFFFLLRPIIYERGLSQVPSNQWKERRKASFGIGVDSGPGPAFIKFYTNCGRRGSKAKRRKNVEGIVNLSIPSSRLKKTESPTRWLAPWKVRNSETFSRGVYGGPNSPDPAMAVLAPLVLHSNLPHLQTAFLNGTTIIDFK